MRKIINTRNDSWTFRYLTKPGEEGKIQQVTVGAKVDLNVISKESGKLLPQPEVSVTEDVWSKIKDKVMPLVGNGLDDKPLRVLTA